MRTALQPGASADAATDPIPAQRDPRVPVDATRDRHPRWRPGDRLEHLFEHRCDPLAAAAGRLARTVPECRLTYAELDTRANRLARHLLDRGIGPGERVALLFDDAVQAYVGMLAALKVGAAYVPLDPGFPADRLAYIVSRRRRGRGAVAGAPARAPGGCGREVVCRRRPRRRSTSTTYSG